jgi:hypothetical protein
MLACTFAYQSYYQFSKTELLRETKFINTRKTIIKQIIYYVKNTAKV